jgi:hypothetical protein
MNDKENYYEISLTYGEWGRGWGITGNKTLFYRGNNEGHVEEKIIRDRNEIRGGFIQNNQICQQDK